MLPAAAGDPRARLLRWLAQRDRSEREMRERLRQWGVEGSRIEALIQELAARGLVDDRALAARICDWTCRHDPQGPRRLRLLLARRGIPHDLAEEALAPYADLARQDELAQQWLARRLPALQGLAPAVRARRVNAALSRRGFAASLVMKITRSLLAEPPVQDGD